jgi:hypothetical protein
MAGRAVCPTIRDDGLVIHLRVVEAVEQVDRAGTRRRQADADLAGELRVRAGHEGRHLLVADLDEPIASPARSSAPRMPLMPSPDSR